MELDIRWTQRFNNYQKALDQLSYVVNLSHARELTMIEQQGLIQAFEFTFELSWNVMKDFLESRGVSGIIGSRDAIRQAFNRGIIQDGQEWMEMINSRNQTSHSYDADEADLISEKVVNEYYAKFETFREKMKEFLPENEAK
jgi:nucleotidyltransferase substrate binding protein (TIGR01987 family)